MLFSPLLLRLRDIVHTQDGAFVLVLSSPFLPFHSADADKTSFPVNPLPHWYERGRT